MHTGDTMRCKGLSILITALVLSCAHHGQTPVSSPSEPRILTGVLSGAYEPANPAPAPALPRGEYAGSYREGFETHYLVACGSTEKWVVYGAESQLAQLRAANPALLDGYGDFDRPVYLRLIGTPSATGNYGHLGSYPRRVDVDEFLEVREWHDNDCAARSGA